MSATNWVAYSSILIASLFFSLINQTNSYRNPFTFTEQTVSEVKMRTTDVHMMYFQKPEEEHKVCLYASVKANLAYIAYNFDRAWRDWVPPRAPNGYGINCKTLPPMYILRTEFSTELKISYIKSKEYTFNAEVSRADFATLHDEDQSSSNRGKFLAGLNEDDRKNLCHAARIHISIPLYFLNKDVPEAHLYDFEYLNEEPQTAHAIFCPTLPLLFLREESSGNKLELVLLPSFIDDYEFELEETGPVSVDVSLLMELFEGDTKASSSSKFSGRSLADLETQERKHLCNIARRYYAVWLSPFVQDIEVPVATLYSFQYSWNEEELVQMGLFCPKLPSLYLRQEDSNQKTKILITFAPNPAVHYTYRVEVVYSIRMLYSDYEAEERRKLGRHHPFNSLNEEDCWNLCFAAQKYLLSDPNRWTFRFAEKERIFAEHWLLLIPEYVSLPEVKMIEYLNRKRECDLVIRCSEFPLMYLHAGKSDDVIEIMFEEADLSL